MQSLVLVVGNDETKRDGVQQTLVSSGCRCTSTAVEGASGVSARQRPDVVVVVTADPNPRAELEFLHRLKHDDARAGIVFVAASSTEDLAIAALRAGAQQYVKGPWTSHALCSAVDDVRPGGTAPATTSGRAGRRRRAGRSQRGDARSAPADRPHRAGKQQRPDPGRDRHRQGAGGRAHPRQRPRARRARSSPQLRARSPRALLESELFGHERGAFTGATARASPACSSAANGGTLFLDEIGDLPPVGAGQAAARPRERKVDLPARRHPSRSRSTCASSPRPTTTSRRAVAEGRFREDLYYRLNVVPLELPPLRERADDVPLLVSHFLRALQRRAGPEGAGTFHQGGGRALRATSGRATSAKLRNVIEALLVTRRPRRPASSTSRQRSCAISRWRWARQPRSAIASSPRWPRPTGTRRGRQASSIARA